MKRLSASLVLAVTIALVSACSSSSANHPPRIFGLSSQGADSGVNTALDTGAKLGRKPQVVNFFEAWSWKEPLPVGTLYNITKAGAIPAITWEPWHPDHGETQAEYSPARIAAGDFDDYITSWATAAAAFDEPMQIRFGHEMNGTWYPWAVVDGRSTAQQYIDAYRHVHDIFLEAGASKVQWVWSIDASSRRPEGLKVAESTYPGDLYVDLVGLDGYNGGAAGEYWQSPEDLFGGALAVIDRVAASKPVWIYETGSGDTLGDKAQWITDLFTYLETTRVSGVLWFDFDKSGEANWLLESPPAALTAASAALSKW